METRKRDGFISKINYITTRMEKNSTRISLMIAIPDIEAIHEAQGYIIYRLRSADESLS